MLALYDSQKRSDGEKKSDMKHDDKLLYRNMGLCVCLYG